MEVSFYELFLGINPVTLIGEPAEEKAALQDFDGEVYHRLQKFQFSTDFMELPRLQRYRANA